MTESNRIEFKRELTRELDIEKEVVAFLNYREGGIIYIGIDDAGKPVGVKDIDSDMLTIKNRLRDNILPSPMGLFDVTAEYLEGVSVIRVFVSSGSEKPYYKKQYGLSPKGCFTRIGIPYAWLPGEENHPEKTISTQKTIQKTIQKKLTTVQKTILEYLAAHPYATQQNMAHDITIVSLGGVKYNLQVLQKNGFLRRVGPDKGGYWEIIEK